MKLTLTTKSVGFLADMLGGKEWNRHDSAAQAVRAIYLAGKTLAALPDYTTRDDTLAAPFEVDEKMFGACQTCLRWFFQQGNVPGGSATNALIDAFDLYKE